VATVLITGSTEGLGRALARELAGRGHEVVVHGRSRERVDAVAREVGASGAHVADFARLDEVRALAEDAQGIEVLVNNAGIAVPDRRLSADGHELTFQVNYLAGFLLTLLMLPPRTVNVASIGQRALDFDDLMLERGYEGYRAYAQSKLAQIMFTIDLAGELEGTGVIANALHPSTYMNTTMVRRSGISPMSRVEDGAEAILQLAVSPKLEGRSGLYFNVLNEARANPQAYDAGGRRKLRALSLELTGLKS
jgi:NAD(P)-dependent dehydrogenase (short-subunit alcohol dehydrogenase family)